MGDFVTLNSPFTPHEFPMASITTLASGKYRAQVYVAKTRDSKSFRTKREAIAWASARELEMQGNLGRPPEQLYTLGQALSKYAEEVSPGKRGERWEVIRLAAMGNILPVRNFVGDVGSEEIAAYRDRRLREVKPGSVLRELGLLSAVFEHAKTEWKWINTNPVRDIRKPQRPDHRHTLITRQQIYLMLKQMGYSPTKRISSIAEAVGAVFLLAMRSGMRAKELCTLTWDNVKDGYCILPVTKTTPRDVPLTPKAERIVNRMRGFDPVYVFGVKTQTLDAMFRRYRDRAGLSGFTFHDSRHCAATWMVANGSLNPLELCKVFGWKDTSQALTYFQPEIHDLVKRMTTPR